MQWFPCGSSGNLLQRTIVFQHLFPTDMLSLKALRLFAIHLLIPRDDQLPPTTTWVIDGNNLKGQRGVPSERQAIADRLKMITRHNNQTNVVLVFDGRRGEEGAFHCDECHHGSQFHFVVTELPQSADDYIVDAVSTQQGRVHVVTADKELGLRARQTRNLRGGAIVNPLKFWKNYIPNLIAKSSD
jgi:hypothetical protein